MGHPHSLAELLAFAAEEVLEEFGAFIGEDACGDLHLMVEAGMVQDLEDGAGGASLGIAGAVDQSRDAGVNERSGAHGAWFDGGIDGAAGIAQTMVPQPGGGQAQGDDFSMGGGIVIEQVAVMARADDFTILDY